VCMSMLYEYCHCPSHTLSRGSRVPSSKMSNRRPQWEDKAGLSLFRH
jgi:hypothetical protein